MSVVNDNRDIHQSTKLLKKINVDLVFVFCFFFPY